MSVQLLLLLGLGSHCKQAGDEDDLPADVSFAHASHLPLPDHVHHLEPLQGLLCRFHRKEAHPGLDQPLDEAMILRHLIVQVFDLVSRSTCSGRNPAALRSAMALG